MKRLIIILAFVALACSGPTVPTLVAEITTTAIPTATSLAAAPKSTATMLDLVAVVEASQSLHVRVLPGEHERVLGYLFNSDAVTLTGLCRDGWAQIVWKSSRAFVKASFLSENRCQDQKVTGD
jgi:hypothetical protein